MARLAPIALFLACAATPAWSQPVPAGGPVPPKSWRFPVDRQTQAPRNFRPGNVRPYEYEASGGSIFVGTEMSSYATVGLGIFGFKPEKAHQAPVTVRELGTPRPRRAGVGVRVKF